MINYNVTDRGDYEEIEFVDWGESSRFDAVYAMYGDHIGAVIREPLDRRQQHVWDEDAEERFRDDVQRFVSDWEHVPDTLIYDPGRDKQSSVSREDFGY